MSGFPFRSSMAMRLAIASLWSLSLSLWSSSSPVWSPSPSVSKVRGDQCWLIPSRVRHRFVLYHHHLLGAF